MNSLLSLPGAIAVVTVAVVAAFGASSSRGAASSVTRQPSPRKGKNEKDITVLSCNAYLIPWFYVYKEKLGPNEHGIDSCNNQHSRAKLLVDLAKEHDVLAFQEIWGAGTDILQRELEASYAIPSIYRGWTGLFDTGYFGDLGNTALGHLRGLGGIWMAACPSSTKVMWSLHHTFKYNLGEEIMNKSVGLMLLDASSKWGPGASLLVVNTHLHSPLPFGQTKERREQRKEISAILSSLPARLSSEGIVVDWSKCGAIFVGDLNTAFCEQGDTTGTKLTPEYEETLKEFDAIDLYLNNESFKAEDVMKFTYNGYTNKYVAANHVAESCRMDYAFSLRSLGNGSTRLMALKATHCKILDDQAEPCSDHFPLSISLVPA